MNIHRMHRRDGARDGLPLRVVIWVEEYGRIVVAAHLYELRGVGNIDACLACHFVSLPLFV